MSFNRDLSGHLVVGLVAEATASRMADSNKVNAKRVAIVVAAAEVGAVDASSLLVVTDMFHTNC
jgi:hypothetical protein